MITDEKDLKKALTDALNKEIAAEFNMAFFAAIEEEYGKVRLTKEDFQKAREEHFKKFPALKDAWDQYLIVEKLCGLS